MILQTLSRPLPATSNKVTLTTVVLATSLDPLTAAPLLRPRPSIMSDLSQLVEFILKSPSILRASCGNRLQVRILCTVRTIPNSPHHLHLLPINILRLRRNITQQLRLRRLQLPLKTPLTHLECRQWQLLRAPQTL